MGKGERRSVALGWLRGWIMGAGITVPGRDQALAQLAIVGERDDQANLKRLIRSDIDRAWYALDDECADRQLLLEGLIADIWRRLDES